LDTVLDLFSFSAKSNSSHFSKFALLAEKLDAVPPTTILTTDRETANGWYYANPTVTLVPYDEGFGSNAQIYYAIDNISSMQRYSAPFVYSNNGISTLYFKSIDNSENVEELQSFVFQVDTQGQFKKKLSIKSVEFKIDN
jgi:hypothetical protein